MAILTPVEAKSIRGRLLHMSVFIALVVGAVTIIYPFLIMVSGSLRSEMDESELDVVPEFVTDEQVLVRKFLETKYGQDVAALNRAHLTQSFSFRDATLPERMVDGRVADFEAFFAEAQLPSHWQALGGIEGVRTVPENMRELRQRIEARFDSDLAAFSRAVGAPVRTWAVIVMNTPEWVSRRFDYEPNPIYDVYFEMLAEAPLAERRFVSISGYFLETMIFPTYGQTWKSRDMLFREYLEERYEPAEQDQPILTLVEQTAIDRINEAWGTDFENLIDITLDGAAEIGSAAAQRDRETFLATDPQNAYNRAHARPLPDEAGYSAFRLPDRVPGDDQPTLRAEWIEFVREELNASFIVLEGIDDPAWRQFLVDRYATIDDLNHVWDTQYASFDEVTLPTGDRWLPGAQRQDYRTFLNEHTAPEQWRLVGPEYAWRDWLRGRYGTLDALNAAHEAQYASFNDPPLPIDEVEYRFAVANAGELRWAYSVRNFINVFDELFVQGRAFLNTVIFCALSILAALLINPMAAYAMSRFKLPGTYKLLLILMATMSFPPMVGMIPQFILLRELNLLNTFIALLLPGLANGYLIFLLKGFFDSLPQELYEAGRIDGASEVRMFFQITLALSKPILAVVALQAFNQAYLMFLYALIVCPDESMWLLSVWLYQYQQRASSAGVFASVLVASIPTLVVFIFAQRTIMRGIVVPTEK